MIYREAGVYKSTYRADHAIFTIPQDRWSMIGIFAIAFLLIPAVGSEYWLGAIMLPFLILALAALGLNILTGYCGQLSLGTGGFMATGAFSAYKLATAFPDVHILFVILGAGLIAAAVGILFGIPSLRIKGFYLAVATLASQFFLIWMFITFGWFTNYSASGVISAPPMTIIGDIFVTGPQATLVAKYLFTLSIVVVMALVAKNLVRSNIGREWMAVRDMDIAAEIIGIPMLSTKLKAFAVSSFFCGVAGALWAFLYTGSVSPLAFGVDRSFQVLFMIIIGGLGSVMGAFLGAAFIVLLPILLNNLPTMLGLNIKTDMISHMEYMIFGALIVFFLIVEPHGLARLWSLLKEKLRLWPFPH
jgi:branched-chain amino acid transport system permease protein